MVDGAGHDNTRAPSEEQEGQEVGADLGEVGVVKGGCRLCGRAMTEDTNCGGDCVYCLANAGDPDAIDWVAHEAGDGSGR